jgi:hypothetical protein
MESHPTCSFTSGFLRKHYFFKGMDIHSSQSCMTDAPGMSRAVRFGALTTHTELKEADV